MKKYNDISNLNEENFSDFISKNKISGLETKENRKEFWKKVLEISIKTKTIERIKLLRKKYEKNKQFKEINSLDDKKTIKKDVQRCIFHQIKEKQIEENHKKQIKKLRLNQSEQKNPHYFEQQIQDFFSEQELFSFYQGFVDVVVYFRLLFSSKKDNFLKPLEIFSNLFLLDYIYPLNLNSNVYESIIKVLLELIGIQNNSLYKLLKQKSEILYTIISWILTYFTHNVSDFEVMSRILDYLIMSPPYAVYGLSAVILCDVYEKNKNDIKDDPLELNIVIKSIDFNDLKIDEIFRKTEKLLDHPLFHDIKNKYKNELFWTFNEEVNGIEFIIGEEPFARYLRLVQIKTKKYSYLIKSEIFSRLFLISLFLLLSFISFN